MTAAGTRARVRAELTREIADVARRHLASAGAAALSLRAVARELGMASSAVYRYFPSRDDLLTALIVDAYDALGEAAERAEAAAPRDDLRARWHAGCTAAREWALAHPHEYALLYGSPVPGYAAPETTIAPAARVALVLCRVLADGVAAGTVAVDGPDTGATLTPGVGAALGLPGRRRAGRAGLEQPLRRDQLRAVRPHPQRRGRPRRLLRRRGRPPGRPRRDSAALPPRSGLGSAFVTRARASAALPRNGPVITPGSVPAPHPVPGPVPPNPARRAGRQGCWITRSAPRRPVVMRCGRPGRGPR
jgi:AcrR family transcriptional regulator